MLNFERTFHAIGQGAFYSECIETLRTDKFIAVYDCGSTTLGSCSSIKTHHNRKLGVRILSDLGMPDVGILFLSHFDMDHINGCKFLNPKIVVIPFLQPQQISVLRIMNHIGVENYDIMLLMSPEQVFPNASIIKVGYSNEETTQSPVYIDLNNLDAGLPDSVPSATPFILSTSRGSGNQNLWEYVVYNPNWDVFFNAFEKDVRDAGMDWDDMIKNPDGKEVYANLKSLKKIYSNLKNKNKHSLIVYSGSIGAKLSLSVVTPKPYLDVLYRCGIFKRNFHDCINDGCLYTGDVTVEDSWIYQFLHFLQSSGRIGNIGTIQIPHHGSWLSKGDRLIEEFRMRSNRNLLCVISVGEDNKYGHPSAEILRNLLIQTPNVFIVTEKPGTMLFECNCQIAYF